MGAQEGTLSARIGGSFRDPGSFVFTRGGGVYRAIDAKVDGELRSLEERGVLQSLVERQLVVGTKWVEEEEAALFRQEQEGFHQFLEHERLAPITYPYEWSVSMLADAALLTLELQIELLKHGMELKDATAYNIQFREGKPVFIDFGSFQVPRRFDLWFALGQFNRHFLFPLLLTRYRGWDLRSYFRANLDGVPPSQVLQAFSGLSRWTPKVLLDVTLPALLEKKGGATSGTGKASWEESSKKGTKDSKGQVLNLQRLQRKVRHLAEGYRGKTEWHDYTATCTYEQEATASKKGEIEQFLKERQPQSVLDLGCNTGEYSRLAAAQGASVIAADADAGAIDLLYRSLRERPARITPVVIDLSNPSPAIGYLNLERESFIARAQSDCVFALALIHHLLVSANLSLEAISTMLAALTRRDLVLEFVPLEDAQFQRILRFRENLVSELTLEACLLAMSKRFRLLAQKPVKGTVRTLLFFELK